MTKSSKRKRDVTVADVAQRAGVGKATASRALGGYGQVSDAKRERVLAAATALGYHPNELARSMNTGRTKTIGIIVGEIENIYFSLATRGISDVAREAGYDVILINTDEEAEKEIDALRVLLDKRVDSVIVSPASAYETSHLHDIIESGRPLVLLDRHIESVDAPSVETDIVDATKTAVEMLLEAGHRRIAFISALQTDGPRFTEFPLGVSSVAQRLTGITAALSDAGIPVDQELLRFQADTPESTQAIVAELLGLQLPPTAFIASDGPITLQVLRSLRNLGVECPTDVSLIGFDDLDWTSLVEPPLTVVSQPIYEIGREAALVALQQIGVTGLPPISGTPFRAKLVVRGSVAPPPERK